MARFCAGTIESGRDALSVEMQCSTHPLEQVQPAVPDGMIPLPSLHTHAAPDHKEPSSTIVSVDHEQPDATATPLAAAVHFSQGVPLGGSRPQGTAAAKPAMGPRDDVMARDRASSGSRWEPLWTQKVVEAAAAVLGEMARSRASSTGAAGGDCTRDSDMGPTADGASPPQVLLPVPAPCPGGSSAQAPEATGLPNHDSVPLATFSVHDLATLLQSLLQVLGTQGPPWHALPPSCAAADQQPPADEQQQQQQQQQGANRSLLAPAAQAPAGATAARELVQALLARGTGAEHGCPLEASAASNPRVGLDSLVDLLMQAGAPQAPATSGGAAAVPTEAAAEADPAAALRAPKPEAGLTPLAQAASTGAVSALSTSTSIGSCCAFSSCSLPQVDDGANSRLGSCESAWEEEQEEHVGKDKGGAACLGHRELQPGTGMTAPPAATTAAASSPQLVVPHALAGLCELGPPHGSAARWLELMERQEGQGSQKQQQQQQQLSAGSDAGRTALSPAQSMASLSLSDSSLHGGRQQLLDWLRQQPKQSSDAGAAGGAPKLPPVRAATAQSLDAASSLPSPHSSVQASPVVSLSSAHTATLMPKPCTAAAAVAAVGKACKGWDDMEEELKKQVLWACQNCAPFIKPQHFDAGVCHWLVQLTEMFGQQAASRGLSSIVTASNLDSVRNMRAFITTRLIDYFEQLVFQQDPKAYAQRRLLPEQFAVLEEVIEHGVTGLEWPHFDPKVLETVHDLCAEYTRSRLQRLSARELTAVKNVPAYIFTLLSKRGKTAKQAAAAKGALCIKDALTLPIHPQLSPFVTPHIPAYSPFTPSTMYGIPRASPYTAAAAAAGPYHGARHAAALRPARSYGMPPHALRPMLSAHLPGAPPATPPGTQGLAYAGEPHSMTHPQALSQPRGAYLSLPVPTAHAYGPQPPQSHPYGGDALLHGPHSAPLPTLAPPTPPLSLLFYPAAVAAAGNEGGMPPEQLGMVAQPPVALMPSTAAPPQQPLVAMGLEPGNREPAMYGPQTVFYQYNGSG